MLRNHLLSLFVVATSAATTAQSDTIQNGQKFGPWTVNCAAVAVGQTACTLEQRLLRDNDNAFIGRIQAFTPPSGDQYFVSAQVPIGAYFPAGIAMRAESAEDPISLVWQTCTAQLCEAMVEVSKEQMDQLSGDAETVIASFQPGVRLDPITFRFSMQGASQGLAAITQARNNN